MRRGLSRADVLRYSSDIPVSSIYFLVRLSFIVSVSLGCLWKRKRVNIPAQLEHKRTWILSPLAGEQVPQLNGQTRGKGAPKRVIFSFSEIWLCGDGV